jgi:hypothetical protein
MSRCRLSAGLMRSRRCSGKRHMVGVEKRDFLFLLIIILATLTLGSGWMLHALDKAADAGSEFRALT